MTEMPRMLTPTCPLCGQPPQLALPEQFFCGNESCQTLMWNPYRGPDQIAEAGFVDLTGLEPKEES